MTAEAVLQAMLAKYAVWYDGTSAFHYTGGEVVVQYRRRVCFTHPDASHWRRANAKTDALSLGKAVLLSKMPIGFHAECPAVLVPHPP